MSTDEIAEKLNEMYEDEVRSLSVEEAIDVNEQHTSYLEGALSGLHADLDAS